MKFLINNLGPVHDATLELGDLTVLCGANSAGKTYVSYLLYSFFKLLATKFTLPFPQDLLNKLVDKGFVEIELKAFEKTISSSISKFCKVVLDNLSSTFSVKEDFFANVNVAVDLGNIDINYSFPISATSSSKIENLVKLSKDPDSSILRVSVLALDSGEMPPQFFIEDIFQDVIGRFFIKNIFNDVFAITSERTGIAIFIRELDISRNAWFEHFKAGQKIEASDIFKYFNKVAARYALPIRDNMDMIRDLEQTKKGKSFIEDQGVLRGVENILQGEFVFVNKELVFRSRDPRDKRKKISTALHMTSTAVKSLLVLDTYIQHIAQRGDILLIDEPELGLHPDNQRKVARLLASLVRHGVRVFITTHSDYIIKEFNNLIMLHSNFEGKMHLLEKYSYEEHDFIDPSRVKAYMLKSNSLVPVGVSTTQGMALDTFDSVINEMNDSSDEIFLSLDGHYEQNN